jgi:hypothetical protein
MNIVDILICARLTLGAISGMVIAITLFGKPENIMTDRITTKTVLDNVEIFLDSIRLFRAVATDLMRLLAHHLNVPSTAFADRYFRFSLDFAQYEGTLVDGWSYWFHGYECRFQHTSTGQTFDVKLGYQHEFGVLDPYFFFQFVSTTPGLESVADLIRNGYPDVTQVFAVLFEQGYLQRIASTAGNRSGLVIVNP